MVHPVPYQQEPDRITPIVRPGTPKWKVATAGISLGHAPPLTSMTMSAVFVGMVFSAIMLSYAQPWPFISMGLFTVLGLVACGTIVVGLHTKHDVVRAPKYAYEGVAIEGKALDVLADVQHRFRWAEKKFGEVPTGIRWSEVADSVGVLLWEAAGHAARVSAIDAELADLGYADEGSPQGALRRKLREQRALLWTRLEDTQWEADDLAREASNAAAAARIALARTGDLAGLELITPTGADLAARGTLAAARARLALLTEVWAELDETTTLTSERLRALPPADPGD